MKLKRTVTLIVVMEEKAAELTVGEYGKYDSDVNLMWITN